MPSKIKIHNSIAGNFVFVIIYPMSIVELEEETQDSIRDFATQRLLEVDLVTVDHFSGIFSSP
jgi:hypothetical protein